MQRVMIIGQPGAGKSTFARTLGEISHLPVHHIDHIHWMSGWQERSGEEKDHLCHLHDLDADPRAESNLIEQRQVYADRIDAPDAYAESVRSPDTTPKDPDNPAEPGAAIDITDAILTVQDLSCEAYTNVYSSKSTEITTGTVFEGDLGVSVNDPDQPWQFDPLHAPNGFQVDTHNAHTQPDGTYHYHGVPNALYANDATTVSPVVGFAADGFPIFGSVVETDSGVRELRSSYQLKSGARPTGDGQPGGTYDGTFRDDYEYVEGSGVLDECNGMSVDRVYRYHMTDGFPHVLGCFRGIPDASFIKRGG